MKYVVKLKYEQNEDFRRLLKKTKGKIIVEDTTRQNLTNSVLRWGVQDRIKKQIFKDTRSAITKYRNAYQKQLLEKESQRKNPRTTNAQEKYDFKRKAEEAIFEKVEQAFEDAIMQKCNYEFVGENALGKKESDIEQVEYNYALAMDAKKQAIIEKALVKLQDEKAQMEAELEQVNKEILNLDNFIEYSLSLRSNLFKMWNIIDLGNKRRLQSLLFPEGVIYNKETGHIEPIMVNHFFTITTSESTERGQKENGRTDVFINSSALAPQLGLEPRTP